MWWEGLPQALRAVPRLAFLSTPTHPTLREGPGERKATEMGKLRGCRVQSLPRTEMGQSPPVLCAWLLAGCPGGRSEYAIKIISLLSSHFSASSF